MLSHLIGLFTLNTKHPFKCNLKTLENQCPDNPKPFKGYENKVMSWNASFKIKAYKPQKSNGEPNYQMYVIARVYANEREIPLTFGEAKSRIPPTSQPPL